MFGPSTKRTEIKRTRARRVRKGEEGRRKKLYARFDFFSVFGRSCRSSIAIVFAPAERVLLSAPPGLQFRQDAS